MQCQGEVTEATTHAEDHWNGRGGAIVRWPHVEFPEWNPTMVPLPVANPERVKVGAFCANCRHESSQHSQGGCSVGFASTSPCGCPMEYDKVRGHLVDPPRSARDRQVGGDHYRKHAIQVWDIVDEYSLSYYAGLALKYLLRAGEKGSKAEDLKKARHVLDRMIEKEE